ncbi:heterokaryon incompatibility protein-domain-containing protein [Dactylonectria macrodidyma]|uniref:Heterokaryon incompatibility protein-domain-containing protein n=1 Tax=Dactylonectria macrodidyma TaxID=307937 RepID=A0A9P9FVM9_9HYPO|nr:heterokaryon incompatibility protein-domain-containing protein [Dactylonectria macrodidyma]
MASLPYRELDVARDEIRLLCLKPGNWDEAISFELFHLPLTTPTSGSPATRLPISALQEGFPDGHVVKETLSGRYIFGPDRPGSAPCSWNHPDPDFDRALYDLAEDDPLLDHGSKLRYEALSYTWASDLKNIKAYAVGSTGEGATFAVEVEIGGNLACALRHLRFQDKERVLWVDALCINQDNNVEKSVQVKRMGRIYSFASRVVVWLGPEDGDNAHAISVAQDLGDEVEVTVDGSLLPAPGASQSDWWDPLLPLRFDERTWSAFLSLFQRNWFSRVWVVQETLLANRHTIVHCGRLTIQWVTLQKAMAVLAAKRNSPSDLKSTLQYQGFGILSPARRTLLRLLSFARHRQCKEPHDKLYGILSLLSRPMTVLISPDYTLPPYQAFMEASRAHLSITHRLEFLTFCWVQQRSQDGPSWVPNWAAPPMNRLFFFRVLATRQASGLSAADVSFPALNTMEVKGVRCCCVDSVYSIAAGSPKDVFRTIRSWEPIDLQTGTYIGGGPMLDAFLEVVFQGCFRERWPGADYWPSLLELRENYVAVLAKDDDSNETILRCLGNGVANDAVYFTTKEGYVGVSQLGIRSGDIVCTLLGCDLPMIFRPSKNGDEFYVIGFCFVHGLMDGESFLGPLPAPWTFKLLSRGTAPVYINRQTGMESSQDPRLPPLTPEWRILRRERKQDDSEFFQDFRNDQTGVTSKSDPRLTREALARCCSRLETFRLI